ncbi:DHA2 family methylenomycin A resistance protein-like MFS transporter [Kribbella sp. VKM Ac-2566]|nr:DHA2 family methylenomycin A resistance protein-like MFS transporter [Kribbella sp. VKM Ac-2566]
MESMLLALLCIGIFLVQLDVTVVNVALPAIRTGLDTSAAGQQWVVSGYMIVLAALLLVCGALGDRIGHRRIVLAGLAVFGGASLVCGTAPGIELLVAARAIQGVGAALLLPGTLAVITDQYADKAARARAVGIWAGAGALALVAGPTLGGVLVSDLGWRSVFLINLPIIAVALPVAWRIVPRRQVAQRETTRRLHIGADFIGANVVAGLMNLVGLGTLLALTLYLQEHLHHSALRAGLELIPVLLPLAVLGPVSGRVTARYGPRLPMSFGLALGAIGSFCLLAVQPTSRYAAVVPVELCLGIGMGFLTAAVVNAAVAALPPDRAGLASGVNNTARQGVGAVGVGLYSTILSHSMPFTTGLHTLAWLGGALWVLGLGITWLTVE